MTTSRRTVFSSAPMTSRRDAKSTAKSEGSSLIAALDTQDELVKRKVHSGASGDLATGDGSTDPHEGTERYHSKFWVFRAARRGDLVTLARAITNTLASFGFVVGCAGWIVAGYVPDKAVNAVTIAGTMTFFGANCLFIATGISWAYSAWRSFMRKYGLNAELHGSSEDSQEEVVVQPGSVINPAQSFTPVVDMPDVVNAFKVLLHFEMMAASCQILGGLEFNIGCILSLFGYPDTYFGETNMFWFLGSLFFLCQGVMSQIMAGSCIGPIMPLVARFHRYGRSLQNHEGVGRGLVAGGNAELLSEPLRKCCTNHRICVHKCIPACLLNTLGSLTFVVASVFLYYEVLATAGAWGYLLGSIFFSFANWADTLGFLDTLAARIAKDILQARERSVADKQKH